MMCLLRVDLWCRLSIYKRRTVMKEERTEEVSLFIAAETVTNYIMPLLGQDEVVSPCRFQLLPSMCYGGLDV